MQNKLIRVIPNTESQHQSKLLAFKLKYITFPHTCKCLKGFLFSFKFENLSYFRVLMFAHFVKVC